MGESLDGIITYSVFFLIVLGCAYVLIRAFLAKRVSDDAESGDDGTADGGKKYLRLAGAGLCVLLLICALFFGFIRPAFSDGFFLLEERQPAYWDILGNAQSVLMEPGDDPAVTAPYVITWVSKDGFGNVSSKELQFYLKTVMRKYPDAVSVILHFDDGTGIDVPINTRVEAAYGRLNEAGQVEFLTVVDLDKPLGDQIDGITSIEREVDENNNPVHEIRYDTAGNMVADAIGVAEYYREYDDQGRIVWERRLGTDGQPVSNYWGTAEYRRVYDGDNIVKESYYDGNGVTALCSKGYSSVETAYDEMGRQTGQRFYDVDGSPRQMAAGYCAVSQMWDGDILAERTYLDASGNPVERTDGYCRAAWVPDGGKRSVHFYDLAGNEISYAGINLVRDLEFGEDGWSEWMSPDYNVDNYCFNIGTLNLGQNAEGDIYTCYLDIEFSGVRATEGRNFRFCAQGAQDGGWEVGNVWNNFLVDWTEAPEDGIYTYVNLWGVNSGMVGISSFDVGFRCDNWTTGSFRVRYVKIEKGDAVTGWTPGV